MARIKNTQKYSLDENVSITDYVIGSDGLNGNPTKNYMILNMFRAFQSFSGVTYMTLSDMADTEYIYYGGSYMDNQWIVFRYPKNDLNSKQQATFGFNMTFDNITDAWGNRQTLTYN